MSNRRRPRTIHCEHTETHLSESYLLGGMVVRFELCSACGQEIALVAS